MYELCCQRKRVRLLGRLNFLSGSIAAPAEGFLRQELLHYSRGEHATIHALNACGCIDPGAPRTMLLCTVFTLKMLLVRHFENTVHYPRKSENLFYSLRRQI